MGRTLLNPPFQRIQDIELKTSLSALGNPNDNDITYIPIKEVHPIIYMLVTNNYATLKELRDDYNMDEVLDLYDMCRTSLTNRYLATKGINNKRK